MTTKPLGVVGPVNRPVAEPGVPSRVPPSLPIVSSTSLLQGARAVCIEHQGALYRLQATRQGKLILTK